MAYTQKYWYFPVSQTSLCDVLKNSYSCEQSKTKQNKAIKKKTLRITLTINIPDFEEESFRFSVSFKD